MVLGIIKLMSIDGIKFESSSMAISVKGNLFVERPFKGIYFVINGTISEFTDKGQFQYLTNLKGPQEGTYLYTTQFLSLR